MRQGDSSLVSILISVGLLILIFAIINYINLTVAQTGFRAKEMASRRLLGASRREIFSKFILESIMVCAFAFIMGLMFAMSLQNVAGDILQRRLDVMGSMTWASSGAYLALIIFMGVVSGVIPAIFISRYKPIDVVKGSFRHRSKMVLSRIFIIFQNVITITLIAASLTMLLQIRHMIETPMGYKTENIIDIPNATFQTLDQATTFKNELKQLASVKEVSLVQGHPFNRGNNWTIQFDEKNISFQTFSGDQAFMEMMGIKVLKDNHLGAGQGVWVNKIAEFDLGLKDGETISRAFGERMPISGVIEDFRVGSLLSLDPQLPPVMVMIYPDEAPFFPWSFLVEVQGDPDAAFEDVRGVYERLAGGLEFNGKFMQDEIKEAYSAQLRTYNIVTIFTLIAVLISMLGLLAMSTYFIQQRASEIAIRKVFGSTRGEMLRRLVLNFMWLVLIAFVLSIPVIWLVMRWWLSTYSHRVTLSPWIFIAAGAFAFITAFATVLWQSSRAANANPIDSIRN
jgi:putative ABC transport system permease protein